MELWGCPPWTIQITYLRQLPLELVVGSGPAGMSGVFVFNILQRKKSTIYGESLGKGYLKRLKVSNQDHYRHQHPAKNWPWLESKLFCMSVLFYQGMTHFNKTPRNDVGRWKYRDIQILNSSLMMLLTSGHLEMNKENTIHGDWWHLVKNQFA